MAHIKVRRTYIELLSIRNQLLNGTISPADAATMIGYVLHDAPHEQVDPLGAAVLWEQFELKLKQFILETMEELLPKV